MSKTEVLKALHSLTLEEMLEVIEVASKLLRQLILPSQPVPEAPKSSAPYRIPGQDKGQVIVATDFNAPLPDSVLSDFLNPL